LPLDGAVEITMEANPGTFESEKFRSYRASGINRLSIGIQSFNPAHLKALGRIHDAEQARRAIEIAQCNFDIVNLDLMYGLPGQTVQDALADIDAALSYSPQHLSAYHLTIEPNTYFHRFPPQLPDDDATAEMQETVEGRLAAAGYEHYEVSAYAQRGETKDDRREEQESSGRPYSASRLSPLASPPGSSGAVYCRHNLNYWTFGDYLGIGAGAHGKLSFADRIVRQLRVKHPEGYLQAVERGASLQEEHDVRAEEIGFQFMMNALRLNAGFRTRLFEERTGLPLSIVLRELDEAERRGFITRNHERVVPTLRGRRFLNDLLQLFLGDIKPDKIPPRGGSVR